MRILPCYVFFDKNEIPGVENIANAEADRFSLFPLQLCCHFIVPWKGAIFREIKKNRHFWGIVERKRKLFVAFYDLSNFLICNGISAMTCEDKATINAVILVKYKKTEVMCTWQFLLFWTAPFVRSFFGLIADMHLSLE